MFCWKDMSSTSQWRCLHLSVSLARGVFGNDMWTRVERVDVPLQVSPAACHREDTANTTG